MKATIRLIITLSLTFVLFSCGFISNLMSLDFYGEGDGGGGGTTTPETVDSVLVQAETLTLHWTEPEPGSHAGLALGYRVYYRERGTAAWIMLDEIPYTPNPMIDVSSSLLPYGKYEFGVTIFSSSDAESALHTSLDPTADPSTGWYVDWRPASV